MMPENFSLNAKHMMWILGILTSIGVTVFVWGWNLSAIAGNVENNTLSIKQSRSNHITLRTKFSKHELAFRELVFQARAQERIIQILQENYEILQGTTNSKMDKILEAVTK